MAFDPNILLSVAQMIAQRRQQDIQKRLGNPSFSRTLGQSFAQGLGEAPGRMLASLPGEAFAAARQNASFEHELKMEDISNPMMEVPQELRMPMPNPAVGPGIGEWGNLGPAELPGGPEFMRANALSARSQAMRPRFEREIEAARQEFEIQQDRKRAALTQEGNMVDIPGQMAGELGLAMPTGMAPVGGGGVQWPDTARVDERALSSATTREGRNATNENTAALRDIQRGDADSKRTKREVDAEHASKKLELDTQDLGIKKERLALDTKAHEETVRNHEAKMKVSKMGDNATTLRARRADATREILAAEKAGTGDMASIWTDAQKSAHENKVKALKAERTEIDNRLDELGTPEPAKAPTGPMPGSPTVAPVDQKLNDLLKRIENG